MYFENIVFDAEHPKALGQFWEKLLRAERLTDNDGGYETRLQLAQSRYLDLCFPTVDDPDRTQQRARLVLVATDEIGTGLDTELNRHQDFQMRQDLAGNQYLVSNSGLEAQEVALYALQLACVMPANDAKFWEELIGWVPMDSDPLTLTHPSGTGPRLMLAQQDSGKTTVKNAIHLDLRLEAEDRFDEIRSTINSLGGREVDVGWGSLAWTVFQDPSGNEFCVLEPLATAD